MNVDLRFLFAFTSTDDPEFEAAVEYEKEMRESGTHYEEEPHLWIDKNNLKGTV